MGRAAARRGPDKSLIGLGYISGSEAATRPGVASEALADPKDKLDLYNQITRQREAIHLSQSAGSILAGRQ
jgi:hypothetical protein